MKNVILLLFVILPMLSFGQYFGLSGIKDSIIKRNHVYKYLEYEKDDSISFFKNYPNGFYGIYNKNGQIVEKNAYSSGDLQNEFFVHFIYDDQGRNIMWLWYDPTAIQKIRRVRIEEFDTLGKNYGYKDFSGNEKYANAYKTSNYWTTDHPNPIEIIDSVISPSTKVYYHFLSKERTDTIEKKTMYYSKEQLDSIVTFFKRRNYPAKSIQKITYFKSTQMKEFEYFAFDFEGKLDRTYKTSYMENGLPDEKWYTSFYKGKEYITYTIFKYEYYKNE